MVPDRKTQGPQLRSQHQCQGQAQVRNGDAGVTDRKGPEAQWPDNLRN